MLTQCYGLSLAQGQNTDQIFDSGHIIRVRMSTLLKEVFNSLSITQMGAAIFHTWSKFDQATFFALATHDLSALEMKARSNQIVSALTLTLPDDFTHAAHILVQSLAPVHGIDKPSSGWTNNTAAEQGIGNWLIMPSADYIALHGNTPEHFDLSMAALHAMTKRFSAEFAIRKFIITQPTKTFNILQQWTRDPDKHVRRLVSEGSRPRLPWGIRLQGLVLDPSPTLALLESLKNDPEDYVRLSVANHLNDIAKDHPALVNNLVTDWLNEVAMGDESANAECQLLHKQRLKLVKHACRTLIKNGNQDTLALFGYGTVQIDTDFTLASGVIKMGSSAELQCQLHNPTDTEQLLLIDYIVHHQKSNGSTRPKVFKWKTLKINPHCTVTFTKPHSFKPITTRKYYPGEHRFTLQINGKATAYASTTLIP